MRWAMAGVACAVVVAVGVVGVLGWAAAPPNVETSETAETQLYVRTVPGGAGVKIDGRSRGTSPLLVSVPPEVTRVVVEVELDGRSARREITVRGGRITRIEFPLAAPGDTGASSPVAAAAGLRLGPVREAILPDPVKRTATLLDLDTGRLAINDEFGEDDRKTHAWIRQEKVDILGAVEGGAPGVLFFDAAMIEVPQEKWDTITAQQITDDQRLNQQEPANIATLTPAPMAPKPEKRPTAIFQTREGAYGILQVIEATEQPKGVKILYRLVAGAGGEGRKRSLAQTTVKELEAAIERYRLDVGRYPPSLSELLTAPPQSEQPGRWSGPYLQAEEAVLEDPWGHPYHYAAPGKHNPESFDLWSSGPDGVEGTPDDIGNWPSAGSAPAAGGSRPDAASSKQAGAEAGISTGVSRPTVGTEAAAENDQATWGPAVDGVRVRLRARRTAWGLTDVPLFEIDLKSDTRRSLPYGPARDEFEVQVDGTWYRHVGPDIRSMAPAPATHREGIHLALLRAAWRKTPDGPSLDLVAGRHTLRVAFLLSGGSDGGKPLRAVSNAVEFEIENTPAQPAPGPPTPGSELLSPRKLFSASQGAGVGVLGVAFSPDGKTVAAIDQSAKVTLRNARAGTQTMVFDLFTADEREAFFRGARSQKILSGGVAFSPDGTALAVGGGPMVKLYDVATGRLDLALRDGPPADEPAGKDDAERDAIPRALGSVYCVAFSPDGTLLAASGDVARAVGEDTGATHGKLRLWDVKTGKLERDLGEWYGAVRSAAFSPDGKTLASIGTHPPDGTSSVRLWDPQTGNLTGDLLIGRGGIPWSVAWSPNGNLLAASALVVGGNATGGQGERDGRLLVWNAPARALLASRPVTGLSSLSFSGDSGTLAAGVDSQGVVLWDSETLQPKVLITPTAELPRAIRGPVRVAFSPTGDLLAIGAEDEKIGLVTVWDLGQPGPTETPGTNSP